MGVRVTRDALSALIEEGLGYREMAQALKVTERSVYRGMVRHGLREAKPVKLFTPDELARARALAAEGMPITWVAEDIGRDASNLYKYLEPREESVHEWKAAWQGIRRSEVLLELHREFSPRREQAA